jgi:hypothetical protein
LDNRLAIRRVPLDAIHPDPANARLHPERNLEAIKASLARFQQVEPLLLQKRSGRLIAGHGRLEAMHALGWTEAEIVELDVDDTTATALAIALNRSGETATWDVAALTRLIDSLKDEFPIGDLGFDQKALDDLLSEITPIEVEQDEVPAPPDAATTRTGDVWVLGRHRLMNGDSSSSDDVDRLLDGAPIHLVNMDPPYNVKVEPRSNNAIAAGLSSFTGTTHHQGLDLARRPSHPIFLSSFVPFTRGGSGVCERGAGRSDSCQRAVQVGSLPRAATSRRPRRQANCGKRADHNVGRRDRLPELRPPGEGAIEDPRLPRRSLTLAALEPRMDRRNRSLGSA